ncbi:MAG TPA: hypothetical protein P5165_05395, partial [Spirochaetia bacterium]|nr:hypothetical protein [Spirochaetia bacterium]
MVIGDSLTSSEAASALVRPGVYAAVGVHPYHPEQIDDAGRYLAAKAPYLVLIGIGGSYLGSRSAIEFLQPEWQTQPERPRLLYFGHHMGSTYATELLKFLDDHDYSACVISKSGSTMESGVAFRILRQHMEKKYTPQEMHDRLLIITEPMSGSLR